MEKKRLGSNRKLWIPEDFEPVVNNFKKIIINSPSILETIPKDQYKKIIKLGLFSHAVRELIRRFVEFNKKQLEEDEKTEDSNI